MSVLTDRLDELPADTRAATLTFFDQRGLVRLMYWRTLVTMGKLVDDTSAAIPVGWEPSPEPCANEEPGMEDEQDALVLAAPLVPADYYW